MRSEAFWTWFDDQARPRLAMRGATFARIFEYLDRAARPVSIVETGCARPPEPAHPIDSTILFDKYAEFHPGTMIQVVDGDAQATSVCRALVSHRVNIATADPVAFLANLAQSAFTQIDLLFLNSLKLDYDDPYPAAWRCMQEFTAIQPLVHADTLVVVDGAPTVVHGGVQEGGTFAVFGPPRIGGNGRLIAEYAQRMGATVHLHGYQSGWIGMSRAKAGATRSDKSVRAVIAGTPQGVFAVDSQDAFVGRRLREQGAYGLAEIEQAASLISTSDNVLVVGAHVGSIAIPLARRCRHLTAVEANPWTYRLLRCNLILNDADNVEAHHFAAGDRGGEVRFVMNRHNSGGSKVYPLIPKPEYFDDNPDITTVECSRLDERLGRHDYSLIFMDAEGSEYAAILGMPRILDHARNLIVEFLPHHLANVAGVGPEVFADSLAPFFAKMLVPSQRRQYPRSEFNLALRQLYDEGRGDAGLVFSK